jgi:hypothetical protein
MLRPPWQRAENLRGTIRVRVPELEGRSADWSTSYSAAGQTLGCVLPTDCGLFQERLDIPYCVLVQLQPAADADIRLIWKDAVAPGSISSEPMIASEFAPDTVSKPDPVLLIW